MTNTIRIIAALASFAAFAGAASAQQIAPGSKYVSMGSSFAAGPGIPTYVDNPPQPCARSDGNYAHQLAKRRNLKLVDVSCSGGVTAHLLGPRNNLPPQLDAVDADTKLVTITIGGNDVNYMSRLTSTACAAVAQQQPNVAGKCSAVPAQPTEEMYTGLAERMDKIAKEVRRRAPSARLIFVDYLVVLPETGTCPGAPLSAAEAEADRVIHRRVVAITAKAAADNGAEVLKASELSKGHDACSKTPWMNGYPRPDAPITGTAFHPNLAGMTAIADALDKLLR